MECNLAHVANIMLMFTISYTLDEYGYSLKTYT